MALRNILQDGDPGLLKKSRVITDFNKRLHILLDDMHETLSAAHGLGLAAPQVGVLRRAILIVNSSTAEQADNTLEPEMHLTQTEEIAEAEETEDIIIELINPELVSSDGEQSGSEGCLSLPGRFGLVTRPLTVKVKAQDRYGIVFHFEASNMTARAVCHEIDHLDGVIFTSKAERMLTEEEVEEMRRGHAKSEDAIDEENS